MKHQLWRTLFLVGALWLATAIVDAQVIHAQPDDGGAPLPFHKGRQHFPFDTAPFITLGDLDGDLDEDYYEHRTDADRVWLNDGAGHFVMHKPLVDDGPGVTMAAALADLDGDGDLDLLLVKWEQNLILLNDGQATFTNSGQPIRSAASRTDALALGDLDGDGDIDAYFSGEGGVFGDTDEIWLNNGAAGFSSIQSGLVNDASTQVVLGDVDQDQDLDLLAAICGNDQPAAALWLNDGAGRFSPSAQAFPTGCAATLGLADLDGDQDSDLVIGSVRPEAVTVWQNDGAGHFSQSATFAGAARRSLDAAVLLLGDGDDDQDLDILLANGRLWRNDGVGHFSQSSHLLPEGGAALRDLDGDGDLDLLTIGSRVLQSWFKTADPQPLPDAVYFLNERNQIARLEANGRQVTLITQEAEPVTSFAVSPDGRRLAYITANTLIESDAFGENRVVKVQGSPYDPTDPQQNVTLRLGPVIYTPDGKTITFGLNGINWIASGANSGDAQVLLPNDPYPAPGQPGPTRFVWPTAWSPDGQRLLLNYVYHASDDLGRRVLDLATGAESQVCRSAVWHRDSHSLFCVAMTYAKEMGMRLDISQVDAATSQETVVVQGVPTDPTADQPYRIFHSVYSAGDDTLLAFGDQWTTPPPIDGPVSFYDVQRYTLQRISADGSQITPLRSDRYRLAGDLLWATDGSGVLISDATNTDGRQAAPLLWLPSDGTPAVELFAVGRYMQWRTQPLAAQSTPLAAATVTTVTPSAATAPVQATILQVLNVRRGPGTLFATLGQLAVGATVGVTGRTDDGSERWGQITDPQGDAGRAWINGDPALVQVATAAPIPVVATPANQ